MYVNVFPVDVFPSQVQHLQNMRDLSISTTTTRSHCQDRGSDPGQSRVIQAYTAVIPQSCKIASTYVTTLGGSDFLTEESAQLFI